MQGGDCNQVGTTIFNVKSQSSFFPIRTDSAIAAIAQTVSDLHRALVSIPVNIPAIFDDERRRSRDAIIKALYDNVPQATPVRTRIVSVENKIVTTLVDDALSSDGYVAESSYFVPQDVVAVPVNMSVVTIEVVPGQPNEASVSNLTDLIVANFEANGAGALYLQELGLWVDPATLENPDEGSVSFVVQSVVPMTEFQPCFNDACLPGGQCAEGHTGIMCTICTEGYGHSSPFQCAKCYQGAVLYVYIIGAALALVAICTVMAYKQIVDGKSATSIISAPSIPLVLKVGLSGLQVMAIAARYDLRWPGPLSVFFKASNNAAGVGIEVVSLDCFLPSNPSISPFWVTCIAFLILPLVAIFLPGLAILILYYFARRRGAAGLKNALDEWNGFVKQIKHDYRMNTDEKLRLAAERQREAILLAEEKKNAQYVLSVWDYERARRRLQKKSGKWKDLPIAAFVYKDPTVLQKPLVLPEVGRTVEEIEAEALQSVRSYIENRGNGRESGERAKSPRTAIRPRSRKPSDDSTPHPPPKKPPSPVEPADDPGTNTSSSTTTELQSGHGRGSDTAASADPQVKTLKTGIKVRFFGPTDKKERERLEEEKRRARAEARAKAIADAAAAARAIMEGTTSYDAFGDNPVLAKLKSVGAVPDQEMKSSGASPAKEQAQTSEEDIADTSVTFHGQYPEDGDDEDDASELSGSEEDTDDESNAESPGESASPQQGPMSEEEGEELRLARNTPFGLGKFLRDEKSAETSEEDEWASQMFGEEDAEFMKSKKRKRRASGFKPIQLTMLEGEELQQAQVKADREAIIATTSTWDEQRTLVAKLRALISDSRRFCVCFRGTQRDVVEKRRKRRLKRNVQRLSELKSKVKKGGKNVADKDIALAGIFDFDETGDEMNADDVDTMIEEMQEAGWIDSYLVRRANRLAAKRRVQRALGDSGDSVDSKPGEDDKEDNENKDVANVSEDQEWNFEGHPHDYWYSGTPLENAERVRESYNRYILETILTRDEERFHDNRIRAERKARARKDELRLEKLIREHGEEAGSDLFYEEKEKHDREREALPYAKRMTAAELRGQMQKLINQYELLADDYKGYLFTTLNVILFFLHPNLSRQFFLMLSCKDIGDASKTRYVLGDMSVECFGSEHMTYLLLVALPMGVLWVLGIPLIAFLYLRANKDLIKMPTLMASKEELAAKLKFDATAGFLYRGYRANRYYWFLLEMARKVLLVGFAIFFPGALHTQLLMACILLFASIVLQMALRPFEHPVPDFVEFLSLFLSFMIFFFANFLFLDISERSKEAVTWIILLLALSFIVCVVYAIYILALENRDLAKIRQRVLKAQQRGKDVAEVIREWRAERAKQEPSRASKILNAIRRHHESGLDRNMLLLPSRKFDTDDRGKIVIDSTKNDTRTDFQRTFLVELPSSAPIAKGLQLDLGTVHSSGIEPPKYEYLRGLEEQVGKDDDIDPFVEVRNAHLVTPYDEEDAEALRQLDEEDGMLFSDSDAEDDEVRIQELKAAEAELAEIEKKHRIISATSTSRKERKAIAKALDEMKERVARLRAATAGIDLNARAEREAFRKQHREDFIAEQRAAFVEAQCAEAEIQAAEHGTLDELDLDEVARQAEEKFDEAACVAEYEAQLAQRREVYKERARIKARLFVNSVLPYRLAGLTEDGIPLEEAERQAEREKRQRRKARAKLRAEIQAMLDNGEEIPEDLDLAQLEDTPTEDDETTFESPASASSSATSAAAPNDEEKMSNAERVRISVLGKEGHLELLRIQEEAERREREERERARRKEEIMEKMRTRPKFLLAKMQKMGTLPPGYLDE